MEKIKIKKVSPVVFLLIGLLLILAGIAVIFMYDDYDIIAIDIALIIYFLIETISYARWKFKQKEIKAAVISIVAFFVISALIILLTNLFYNVFVIFIAIILFVLFIVRVAICIHLFIVDGPGLVKTAVQAILCLAGGVMLCILKPPYSINLVLFVLVIYLILYGITRVSDFFAAITKADLDESRSKRRMHISLPNIVSFRLTEYILDECTKVLDENENVTVLACEKEGENADDVNFEILLHVSRIPGKGFGHVDICIDDTIYTYGCYDSTSCKFGGLFAGGVFMIVPKKPYIDNCLKNQRKYIVSYGCKLSEEQLSRVKARINEFLEDTVPMDVDISKEETRLGGDGVIGTAKMGGKSYSVVKGPFKTYFVVSTNCVALADTIIGKAGLDSLSSGSLTTPGAYFKLLDVMFRRSNTVVIRRTVYLQSEAGEKKKQDINDALLKQSKKK